MNFAPLSGSPAGRPSASARRAAGSSNRKALVALGLAIALLAGCVTMPDDGPVSRGVEHPPEPDAVLLAADDPQPDDPPEQIVRGFLFGSAAGATDDFTVARRYLTPSAAENWNALSGLAIYSGEDELIFEEVEEGRIEVTATLSGTVDAAGVYTPSTSRSPTSIEFGLSQDANGQWRIDELSDGVLISEVNFGSQFAQVPLYFLTPDTEMLVPDVRWYPQRNSPSAAVQGLLNGPVPWLNGPLFSAIPEDTSLALGAVTVTDRVAHVDLTGGALDADATARQLMRAQIEQTLLHLPQVLRVHLTVDGVPWEDPLPGFDVDVDPSVGRVPVVYETESHQLGRFTGGGSDPVSFLDDAVDLSELNPGRFALGYNGEPGAMLSGTQTLITVPTTEDPEPQVLAQGEKLLAPSYDRHGWVWTGESDNDGSFVIARAGGETLSVDAAFLAESQVTALRVSRDGARIALIHTVDGQVLIEVAAIIRDDSGTPISASEGVRVAPHIIEATELAWVDEQVLAILGTSNSSTTPHLTAIGGLTMSLTTQADAVGMASGRGDRDLYLVTESGTLYERSGVGWRPVGDNVANPTFPG